MTHNAGKDVKPTNATSGARHSTSLDGRGAHAADMDAAPHPWDYNPSSWSQRVPICILAGVGFVIAGYMALFQWELLGFVWDPVFGRQTALVLTSDVSHYMWGWFRIPDAAMGALAYLGDAVFGLAGSTRRWQYRPWLVILFGIDVIPLGIVSAVLVVLQGAVVGSWCFLCLVTAVISLVLVYMAFDEVWTCLIFLYRVWRKTHSPSILWKAFCGFPSAEAAQVGEQMTPRAGRHGTAANTARQQTREPEVCGPVS